MEVSKKFLDIGLGSGTAGTQLWGSSPSSTALGCSFKEKKKNNQKAVKGMGILGVQVGSDTAWTQQFWNSFPASGIPGFHRAAGSAPQEGGSSWEKFGVIWGILEVPPLQIINFTISLAPVE